MASELGVWRLGFLPASRTRLCAPARTANLRQRRPAAIQAFREDAAPRKPAGDGAIPPSDLAPSEITARPPRPVQHTPHPSRFLSEFDGDILRVAAPAFLPSVAEPLMALVDTALIGRLGVVPLGAVGLGAVVYLFCINLFQSLQVVATTRIGAYADTKAIHRASPLMAHSLWLAVTCGIALAVGLYLGAPNILRALNPGSKTAELAVQYLRVRSWAAPASLVLFALTGGARGVKDTRTALKGSLLQYLMNIGLDWYLIFGLGWGVRGAAAAAVLAQYSGAAAVFMLLLRNTVLKLKDLGSYPSWSDIKPYAQAGWRLSLTNIASNMVGITASSLASALGPAALAAHVIGTQLVGFTHQYFLAFHIAALSLVSIEMGNQSKERAQQVLVRTAEIALGVGLPAVCVLWVARGRIPAYFTSDPQAMAQAAKILPLIILYMPLDALGTVSEGGLLGAMETGWVARRTTGAALVALALLAAARQWRWGLVGIYIGLRALNVGTLVADLPKWLSRKSPFSTAREVYNP